MAMLSSTIVNGTLSVSGDIIINGDKVVTMNDLA